MPHIKNALIRYRIIDRMLRNKYKTYPSKADLREACEEALYGESYGDNICYSTIEKDMFAMKMDHDAPIKYSKSNAGYYYLDPDFSINDIPLSEDELSSIRFAVNTLQQFREVPFFSNLAPPLIRLWIVLLLDLILRVMLINTSVLSRLVRLEEVNSCLAY